MLRWIHQNSSSNFFAYAQWLMNTDIYLFWNWLSIVSSCIYNICISYLHTLTNTHIYIPKIYEAWYDMTHDEIWNFHIYTKMFLELQYVISFFIFPEYEGNHRAKESRWKCLEVGWRSKGVLLDIVVNWISDLI